MDESVVCGRHGETPATFLCVHLATGIACGFHSDGEGDHPDAVCDRCEERHARGEMLDPDDLRVLCTHCYEEVRARNVVPEHARGVASAFTDNELDAFVEHAVHAAQAKQEAANAKWSFQKYKRWDYDAGARTLTFTDPERARLVADVRLVGSFAPKAGRFQWSWVLYKDDDPAIRDVPLLRAFGEVRDFRELRTKRVACDEAHAWSFASIAGYLLGCEAYYRAPFDDLYWFMLLDRFRAVQG